MRLPARYDYTPEATIDAAFTASVKDALLSILFENEKELSGLRLR